MGHSMPKHLQYICRFYFSVFSLLLILCVLITLSLYLMSIIYCLLALTLLFCVLFPSYTVYVLLSHMISFVAMLCDAFAFT